MKISVFITIALSVLMVGCGGSGGKSSKPNSSSTSSVPATSTVSSSAQASSIAAVLKGVFLDAAVANIGYRTTTQQGFTNVSGEFNYRSGELITFFIGNLELPSVMGRDIITPLDIANTQSLTDNQLINILRLLQSLDADDNASNGIEITAAAIAAGTTLDFTLAPEVFAQLPAVQTLLQAANKQLISAEQAIAHFQTTLELINGSSSSSTSSINDSSSSTSSDDVIVIPGSSSASSDAGTSSSTNTSTSTSSAASSDDVVIIGSSSSSSSEQPDTPNVWNVYNGAYHPATNGSVTLANGTITEFGLGATADHFTALVDGTVSLDTSDAVANTSGATIANIVNADGIYPKYFTLIAGITGHSENLRVLELEVAMADTGVAGSRLKTILRNDGSNKGVQLESANNGASANSYGLNMNTFGIYQIAITLTNATTGSVNVYRDGQQLPNLSLSNVTMRAASANGDNFLRFGEVSGSAAYKANIDWIVWTNQAAYTPAQAANTLPANLQLGCVYGYGTGDNTSSCINPPIVSSSSVASSSSANTSESGNSDGSSSASNSSVPVATGDLRPAKIEGFAAYANVTGGAGGPVITVSTGTELNAALCGVRKNNRAAPVIIMVNGTINHGNTSAQGCDTQNDVIEIKKTSNISIIGVGTNALFDEIGIHVRDASNVIIQNVHVRNVKKSGTPTSNGGDAIGLETNVDRVWIDHNHLEASGGEKDGYDSLIDMKSGVTNVTVSYNKFNDSSRAGLVGFNDSDANNNITFHHNWYKNIEQRTPLIRNALVHVYNNYWSNESITYMIHAINSRANAKVLVESNYFYNVNNPLIASKDSPTPGCWQTNNENTVLPYIYYSRTVENGEAHAIPAVINNQLQSNCAVTVPYTVEMDHSSNVPAIVMANAGVGKITVDGGASSSNGSTNGSSSTNSSSLSSANVSNESSSVVSSAAGNSDSSSSAVSSSSPSIVIVNTSLPLQEDFNNVVDAAGFFSTAYKPLATKESPFYHHISGSTSFANGAMVFGGARLSLGNTTPETATTSADIVTTGEFDLSQPYRISFCVKAAQGAGAFQVLIDNNTTGATNSIHAGSSRIYSVAANSLNAGQRVVINSTVGRTTSFIALRTESSAQVTIDNLWIGYQSNTISEPAAESCISSATSSIASSVASSEATSSVSSSVASSETSSSSVMSSDNNQEFSSSSTSSEAPGVTWNNGGMDLSGSSGNAPTGSVTNASATGMVLTASGGNVNSTNRRYYFSYQQVTGNFIFTARLANVTATGGSFTTTGNNAYRFGLLITENIDAVSAYINSARFAEAGFYTTAVGPVFRGSRGYKLDTGPNAPNFTRSDIGVAGALGIGTYMRIARDGTSVTISYSTNGTDYTVANTSTFAQANSLIPDTWYVGLFSAPQQELNVEFDNISIVQN